MARNRLQPFGASNRTVRVDPDATNGATVGVNLYDQVGNLVDLDALIAQAVADAGTGGSAPSSDLTTDEVIEGRYNFYFTTARAYSALKAQLKAGANVTVTPDDGAETITIAASGGGASRSLPQAWVFA